MTDDDDVWLVDLFCGAGGATKGYQRAGFKVCGVDIHPQPNYCGDEFVQADALGCVGAMAHRDRLVPLGPDLQGRSRLAALPAQ